MILPELFLVLFTSRGVWGRIIIRTVPTNLSIPTSCMSQWDLNAAKDDPGWLSTNNCLVIVIVL